MSVTLVQPSALFRWCLRARDLSKLLTGTQLPLTILLAGRCPLHSRKRAYACAEGKKKKKLPTLYSKRPHHWVVEESITTKREVYSRILRIWTSVSSRWQQRPAKGETGAISNISAHSWRENKRNLLGLGSLMNTLTPWIMKSGSRQCTRQPPYTYKGDQWAPHRLAEVMVQGLKDFGFQVQMVMVSDACRDTRFI